MQASAARQAPIARTWQLTLDTAHTISNHDARNALALQPSDLPHFAAGRTDF
ncbi:MAG: hypothetical protein ABI867_39005 [Kofleriaceae bacterium]